jgi:hypothetical protein
MLVCFYDAGFQCVLDKVVGHILSNFKGRFFSQHQLLALIVSPFVAWYKLPSTRLISL